MSIRAHGLRAIAATMLVAAMGGAHVRAEPHEPPQASPSSQQASPVPPQASPVTQQDELRGVEDTLKSSKDQGRKIEADVEAIKLDRVRLSAALIETTSKIRETENDRAGAIAMLAELTKSADALETGISDRRDSLADLLAALQRMGRDPPPAILVKPEGMREAVRAATVLGGMVADIREETEGMARDLANLSGLKDSIAKQRDALAATAASLDLDKARLAELVQARQSSLDTAQGALEAQRKRAEELASHASNLKDLIAKMEDEVNAGQKAARTAAAADRAAAADVELRAVSLRGVDPARLKPAVPFPEVKGQLNLPVAGAVLKPFGAPDGFGGQAKGVSIATPVGALVSTPIDGWVVFSGPYRSYGQLLIINAGEGYYMVLAGMDHIHVSVGQFVLAGEPVAIMGDGTARTSAVAAIGAARPVLYIELRKNETAIDPQPWWIKSNIEKARG